MIRTAIAALYLITIPGTAAWAQAARVVAAPETAVAAPIALPPSALPTSAEFGPGAPLSAPALSGSLSAPALPLPAAAVLSARAAAPLQADADRLSAALLAARAQAEAGTPAADVRAAEAAAAADLRAVLSAAPSSGESWSALAARVDELRGARENLGRDPVPADAAGRSARSLRLAELNAELLVLHMRSALSLLEDASGARSPDERRDAALASLAAAADSAAEVRVQTAAAADGELAAAPRRWDSGLASRLTSSADAPAPAVARAVAAPAVAAAPSRSSLRRLWGYLFGTFGAQLASNSLQVTMPLLFLKLTGSASHAAFAVAIGSALDASGTLVGGWLTDRVRAKNVLLATTAARGAAVLALPLFAAAGGLSLPIVAAAYLTECFARGIADTARSTLPTELSGRDGGLLKTILAKNQVFFEAGGIAGPFLAGLLIAGLGGVASAAALWLGPAVFAAVALCYLAMPKMERAAPAAPSASAPAAAKPTVLNGWMGWALAATALLSVYPLKGLLPAVFATQILHDAASAAWLTGLFGVGGFFGSLAYGRLHEKVGFGLWMTLGALGTLAFAVAFLPGAFLPAALGVLAFSFVNGTARLALSAAIQSRAAPGQAGAAMGPARFTANLSGLALRFLFGMAFAATILPMSSFWIVGSGLTVAGVAMLYVAERLAAPVKTSLRLGALISALGFTPGGAGPRPSAAHGLPGRLIVVEGLDGSGKSTQMERLKEELESRGLKVVATSWNSSETVSDAVKGAKKKRTLDPQTFALLNAADLSDRLDKTILPALKEGSIVLADRWVYTALARDRVRGNDAKWLRKLYKFAPKPDLVLYFRLPVKTAIDRVLARAEGKGAALSENFDEDSGGKVLGQNYYAVGRDQNFSPDDRENFREFQTRVTAEYDAQAKEFGFRMIDAAKSRDVVFAAVMKTALKDLGPLESFRRRDGAGPGENLFDKDPAGDAENIRRNYMKEKRGAHFYFRNMLLPMQERFAQLMNMAAMPQVLLHGSPHLDNYAKSHQGAAMVDFDRSRVGPYAWDLVRLMVSLSLRQKKPVEGLLDPSVLKQLKKGYLHGFRHPNRPFSEARIVKDVEAEPGEETTDAYLAKGKWAQEMRANPLPLDDADVVQLIQGYNESLGGGLLDDYKIEEAGRGQGSMGFRGLFLVVLAPKDKSAGLDRILLNIKQVRADPDTQWYKNPFATEIERMHRAAELYAPGWALRPGNAMLDGVEYDVRQIDPLNVKVKKMLNLEQQADIAYAVGTQLGRAHRLSLQNGATPAALEKSLEDEFDAVVAAGLTIRDEIETAHERYLKNMRKAGLTLGEGDDEE
jgi:dTMP kinase